jgi:hypothetical protein
VIVGGSLPNSLQEGWLGLCRPKGARHGRFTLTPGSGLVKVGNHVGRPLSPLPLLSRDEEDLLHSRWRLVYVEVSSDSKQSSEYQHTGASRPTLIDSQSEVKEFHPISRPSFDSSTVLTFVIS